MTDTSAAPSELLSAEGLGQLLAATTRCHSETAALRREMGERFDRHGRRNEEMIAALRGELLEAQAERLEEIAAAQDERLEAIRASIAELTAAQRVDDLTRAKGSALLSAGRWLVGIAIGSLISGATYLYQESAAHATQLARHGDAIAAVRDDARRHERAPAHTGSQQRLSDLSGDLRALTVRIEELRSSVDRMADRQTRAPSMRPPRR